MGRTTNNPAQPAPRASLLAFDENLVTTTVREQGVAVLYDGLCAGAVKVDGDRYFGHLKRTYDDGALVQCTEGDQLDRVVRQVAEQWWLSARRHLVKVRSARRAG